MIANYLRTLPARKFAGLQFAIVILGFAMDYLVVFVIENYFKELPPDIVNAVVFSIVAFTWGWLGIVIMIRGEVIYIPNVLMFGGKFAMLFGLIIAMFWWGCALYVVVAKFFL